ncbi:MAG: hypothetical protein ACFFAH_13630 [Promethearchaeota archaeon]
MLYIFTNIGPGNGPYIRTIEMGFELIQLLREQLDEDIRIIVPWAYGEKQKCIIFEEFDDNLKKDANSLLLDKYLGQQFKKILYDGRNYNAYMLDLVNSYDRVENNIQEYLKKDFIAENINGEKVNVHGENILLEVSRNPCVATGIKFSYYTSIGYFEKIIKESLNIPNLNLKNDLLAKVLKIARKVESYQQLYFQPEPNCFSFEKNKKSFKDNEIKCPPLFHPPVENVQKIEEGCYLLVSGIPHLESMYQIANKLKLKIYISQNIKNIEEAQRERPNIISNKNIKFVLARAAWNTIWLSNLSKKPLICLNYINGDSPEIYFNIISVKKRNLGIIFNEKEDINDLIERSKSLLPKVVDFYSQVKQKFNTFNGIEYSCKRIARDFLEKFNQ